jgi:enamine deaminase RidA (YjgF/YER057c/UK114 family)
LDVVDRGWGEIWMEFMDKEAGGHRPPDTVVGVASLAKKSLLYECEVWAITSG